MQVSSYIIARSHMYATNDQSVKSNHENISHVVACGPKLNVQHRAGRRDFQTAENLRHQKDLQIAFTRTTMKIITANIYEHA